MSDTSENLGHWTRWVLGTLLGIAISGFAAYAYLNESYVSRVEYQAHVAAADRRLDDITSANAHRLDRIETKLDRLIERGRND